MKSTAFLLCPAVPRCTRASSRHQEGYPHSATSMRPLPGEHDAVLVVHLRAGVDETHLGHQVEPPLPRKQPLDVVVVADLDPAVGMAAEDGVVDVVGRVRRI